MNSAGGSPDPAQDGATTQDEGRHVATLLFCDLCDSTRLASELEAEDYADILGQLRRHLDRVAPAHGGRIVQIYGDGALILFSEAAANPRPGVESAIEAALALHAEIAALPPVAGIHLALHSGIHSGLVVLREGGPTIGQLQVLGLAPNIAARLAAAAGQGELLVSTPTLGPARWRYRAGPQRVISIDRGGDTVQAVPILERASAPTRLAATATSEGLTPFVGRTAELDRAVQLLATARTGESAALMFAAAPGQGKSRFAAEAAAIARRYGHMVLAGASERDGEPLQPFRQMMRILIEAADTPGGIPASEAEDARRDPALAAILDLPAAELVRAGDPVELADAVRNRLERLAQYRPLLLLFDDWHWADSASILLLKSLIGARGQIAMLLLSRPPEPGTLPIDGLAEQALPPLPEEDGIAMVRARLPAVDSLIAARIHRAAGGNPLYIEELCHLAGAGQSDLPDVSSAGWFAAAVEARYRRLPAPIANLVQVAAVFGMTVPEDLLAEIAGISLDPRAKAELAQLDLLFPAEQPGALRFKHGLTRDILYRLLPAPARHDLHARIAAALEARDPDAHEALAVHFANSDQHARAADHAEKAAQIAAAAAAIDRAQTFYKMALNALDKLPQSPEVSARWSNMVRRYAMAAIYDADKSQLDLFSEARRRAHIGADPTDIAQCEYWIAFALCTIGRAKASLPHFEAALSAAGAIGSDRMAAEVRASKGYALSTLGAYAQAQPLLEEGARLVHKNGRPSLSAIPSLAYKGAILGDQGDFEAAYACFEDALAMIGGARHQVEATVQCWYAQVLLWHGQPEAALVHALRDREVTELTENAFMNGLARNFCAAARFMLHPSEAERTQMDAAVLCLEARHKLLYSSMGFARSADAAAHFNDLAGVRHFAARALNRARNGDILGAAMAWRALASVADTPRRGHYCLAQAHAIADRRNSPHERAATHLAEAELALRFDGAAAVRAPLDRAQLGFDCLDMPWFKARAARLRAQL